MECDTEQAREDCGIEIDESVTSMPRIRFSYYESCKVILGIACIALSLGWGKFVGKTVYLPFYPDALDVILGIVIGTFLIFDYVKRTRISSNPANIQSSNASTNKMTNQ